MKDKKDNNTKMGKHEQKWNEIKRIQSKMNKNDKKLERIQKEIKNTQKSKTAKKLNSSI